MATIGNAVRHLSELHRQITSFMAFLVQIARIIDKTVETSEFVHETAEDTDEMLDPMIKHL